MDHRYVQRHLAALTTRQLASLARDFGVRTSRSRHVLITSLLQGGAPTRLEPLLDLERLPPPALESMPPDSLLSLWETSRALRNTIKKHPALQKRVNVIRAINRLQKQPHYDPDYLFAFDGDEAPHIEGSLGKAINDASTECIRSETNDEAQEPFIEVVFAVPYQNAYETRVFVYSADCDYAYYQRAMSFDELIDLIIYLDSIGITFFLQGGEPFDPARSPEPLITNTAPATAPT